MIRREKDGISWLEFEILAECPIVHGCFNRHGGVSKGVLESLNIGRNCGDIPENVIENKRRIMNALGTSRMAVAKCNHGDTTISLDSIADIDPQISDGIATDVPGLALCVTQADCQAAIFYDPIHHVVSNVHCGWRGNVQNIYGKNVQYLQARYGSKPENLLVCISPSLGPESSEFLNCREELPAEFFDFQIKPNYFDLWAISRWQLSQFGVLAHHIQIAGIDTYTNNDYFSFRREKNCGRQATVVLNP